MAADNVYDLIKQAILAEQQVIANYKGGVREMCPQEIGVKNGRAKAPFYQFAGYSRSGIGSESSRENWRCMDVAELLEVSVRPGRWHTAKAGHSKETSCIDQTDIEWWADVASARTGSRP